MSFEHGAEHSVVVANEIFWGAVPWKRFRDLARQPVGRRIASPQTTATVAARGREPEMRTAAETQSSEPQINRSMQSLPCDCQERSSKSATDDLTAAPCRSKLWIGRPRCRA